MISNTMKDRNPAPLFPWVDNKRNILQRCTYTRPNKQTQQESLVRKDSALKSWNDRERSGSRGGYRGNGRGGGSGGYRRRSDRGGGGGNWKTLEQGK